MLPNMAENLWLNGLWFEPELPIHGAQNLWFNALNKSSQNLAQRL